MCPVCVLHDECTNNLARGAAHWRKAPAKQEATGVGRGRRLAPRHLRDLGRLRDLGELGSEV